MGYTKPVAGGSHDNWRHASGDIFCVGGHINSAKQRPKETSGNSVRISGISEPWTKPHMLDSQWFVK